MTTGTASGIVCAFCGYDAETLRMDADWLLRQPGGFTPELLTPQCCRNTEPEGDDAATAFTTLLDTIACGHAIPGTKTCCYLKEML